MWGMSPDFRFFREIVRKIELFGRNGASPEPDGGWLHPVKVTGKASKNPLVW